nr:methyltransferase domain-containing protein [Azospirillum sp. INR13]
MGEADRVVAVMPASQGVSFWPAEGPGMVALGDEADLPFGDNTIDRVLLVHGLEGTEQLRPMMREIWRVLAGGGRVLAVVPNRRGLWARARLDALRPRLPLFRLAAEAGAARHHVRAGTHPPRPVHPAAALAFPAEDGAGLGRGRRALVQGLRRGDDDRGVEADLRRRVAPGGAAAGQAPADRAPAGRCGPRRAKRQRPHHHRPGRRPGGRATLPADLTQGVGQPAAQPAAQASRPRRDGLAQRRQFVQRARHLAQRLFGVADPLFRRHGVPGGSGRASAPPRRSASLLVDGGGDGAVDRLDRADGGMDAAPAPRPPQRSPSGGWRPDRRSAWWRRRSGATGPSPRWRRRRNRARPRPRGPPRWWR